LWIVPETLPYPTGEAACRIAWNDLTTSSETLSNLGAAANAMTIRHEGTPLAVVLFDRDSAVLTNRRQP
jgi:hypothetical protein